MALTQKSKTEVLPPRNAIALDTLAGVRGEMARLYRLALNGRIRSDEMKVHLCAEGNPRLP